MPEIRGIVYQRLGQIGMSKHYGPWHSHDSAPQMGYNGLADEQKKGPPNQWQVSLCYLQLSNIGSLWSSIDEGLNITRLVGREACYEVCPPTDSPSSEISLEHHKREPILSKEGGLHETTTAL